MSELPTAEERVMEARAILNRQVKSRYFAGDRQAMLRALAALGDPSVTTMRIRYPVGDKA